MAAECALPRAARRWTRLPTGASFLGGCSVDTDGDLCFDPVLEIEGSTLESYTQADAGIDLDRFVASASYLW
jgi:hypothetical protein